MILKPKQNKLLAAGWIEVEWTYDIRDRYYEIWIDNNFYKIVSPTSGNKEKVYIVAPGHHTVEIKTRTKKNNWKREVDIITFDVTKRGIGLANSSEKMFLNKFFNKKRNIFKKIDSTMGWYYNWNSKHNPSLAETTFVPMVWGPESLNELRTTEKSDYLLAFNEPDMFIKDGGCDLHVEYALNTWYYLRSFEGFLGAPSAALLSTWEEGDWIREFMDQVDYMTVDFIPIHCYYGTYGGRAAAKSFLEEVVDAAWATYHKPIWITEFGISGWAYDDEYNGQVKEFLEEVIKGLDNRPFIERYAWFPADIDGPDGASALWNKKGELTELGEVWFGDNGSVQNEQMSVLESE